MKRLLDHLPRNKISLVQRTFHYFIIFFGNNNFINPFVNAWSTYIEF